MCVITEETDIDRLYYESVDLLKRLVSTPRHSREEGAAADEVERFMAEAGLQPRRLKNNVWSVDPDYDAGRPTILLNSHIDTVRPVEGWSRDPYCAEVDEEGRLYGLGSNDAGGSLVSLIAAYRVLTARADRGVNYVMVASAEEEVSGRDGLEAVLAELPPIAWAVVGEPTGMRPAVAEKGLLVLDGVARGVAGHAARDEGDNALYRAIDAINTLRGLKPERESAMLGPVKMTVTMIGAGTQHNVVPDECRFVVDVRTTDAYSNEETLELIRRAVPDVELTPRSMRLRPSFIAADNVAVRRAAMLGLEPMGSPTLSDQALMPWESVKMGPGESSRSHHADEYIMLDEVRAAIDIYVRLLA